MRSLKITMLLASLLVFQSATADPIFYEVSIVDPATNTWQYSYTVGNDALEPIDWFTIWFDPELYAFDFSAVIDGPAGWDIFAAAPEFLFPGSADNQPGFLDACGFLDDFLPCAGNAAVLMGDLLGAFTIDFNWLGAAGTTPGSQPFTLFGDGIPDVPDRFTQPLPVVSVSEPGTLLLFSSGLLLLGLTRRRRLPQSDRPDT